MAKFQTVRFLLCALFLFCGICAFAQRPLRQAGLEFEETTWDFGEIREADGAVSHQFNFINVSGKDVSFLLATGGCSCTTISYDRSAIPPGEASSVKVTFDPAGQPGQFHQVVQLVTSGDRQQYNLVIEGVVAERERPVDQLYPYPLVTGLQVSGLTARFGFVQQGTSLVKRIGIANTSDRPVELGYRLDSPDPAIKVTVPDRLESGQSGEVEIEFAPERGRLATLGNGVAVYSRGEQPGKSIALEGYSVSTTQGSAQSPSLRFQPTLLDFGTVRPGKKAKASVTLFNDGANPLVILKAELPEGLIIKIKDGTQIKKGEKLKLDAELTVPKGETRNGDYRVRLFTNDPQRPVRDVVCKMTIKQ